MNGRRAADGERGGRATAPRPLRTADFEYELPTELVARHPAPRRDASRLLVVHRRRGRLEDRRFSDLPDYPEAGDAVVLNDTRVFPARLLGRKPTGARAEILLLRPVEGAGDAPGTRSGAGRSTPAGPLPPAWRWHALVRPGGKLKPGGRVVVSEELAVEIEDAAPGGGRVVRLVGEGDPRDLLERHGRVPLPPYLGREEEPDDRRRYQTVYARRTGSVAAPTAGLHFTPRLLARLEERRVRIARVTLHVGVGTFRPVEAERPEEHELHAEPYEVGEAAAALLDEVRGDGGRVWAVGTTVVRALETAAGADGRVRPGAGWTDLFIHPPYRFRAVDGLLTNFHLPRSSLLMLVAAFAGHALTLRAYEHAVARRYRFYSYGDAMLVV